MEKQVTARTTSRYLEHYNKTHGSYFTTLRGRPPLLTAEESASLVDSCSALRAAGKSLCAGDVCAMAIGIVDRNKDRRALLAINGGPLLFSVSWGNSFLKSNGFTVRAATTDRTVPACEVVAAGAKFFADLNKLRDNKDITLDTRLTFNMDEFFVQLDANRSWTWHRVVKGQPISISKLKLGFTASVCTSAAGEVVLVQIIWQGKTDAVHVDDLGDERIVQMHRDGSHFQNAETFKQWATEMVRRIGRIRERENIPEDVKAVMILDQAPQHGEVEIPGWSELIHLAIPKKMTHIFQPADSFIIANIKRWTKCAWRGYLQQVFRDNTIAEAVKDTIVKSLPVLRARKFSFIKAGAVQTASPPLGSMSEFFESSLGTSFELARKLSTTPISTQMLL